MAENNNALPKKKRKSSIKVDHADDGGENSNNEVEATHDEEIEAEKIRLKRLKKEAKKLRKLQSSSQLSSDPAEEHSKPTTDSNNDLETAPAWNEKHKSNKNKALKMSHKEIEDFRFAHGITVYPGEESHTYAPFTKFSKLQGPDRNCSDRERQDLAFLIPALLKLAQLGLRAHTHHTPTSHLTDTTHRSQAEDSCAISTCADRSADSRACRPESRSGNLFLA
ncbi:unnamed protein product [Sphagnum compactum]